MALVALLRELSIELRRLAAGLLLAQLLASPLTTKELHHPPDGSQLHQLGDGYDLTFAPMTVIQPPFHRTHDENTQLHHPNGDDG